MWSGSDREACLPTADRPEVGACWAFVRDRFSYFIYGSYPIPERWRVDIFFAMLAVGIVWLLWLEAPRRDLGALYFFVVVPVVSYILLNGFEAIGLRRVDTSLWGGVLVTIVVSWVGIVFSLPIGILLALGRRSHMPAVKLFSVIFIEFVRGVPLITVLFMASVMLPLFVPDAYSPDKLLRALIGIAMFASAYMAEVVRGGLQAIPKGQYEGAMAVGLGYWQMMRLIILPQALKITIPNIVNTYHRPVQGHDAGRDRRHLRFPAHRRSLAHRSEMGGADDAARPATPSPRCSTSSSASACRATPRAWKRGSPRATGARLMQ